MYLWKVISLLVPSSRDSGTEGHIYCISGKPSLGCKLVQEVNYTVLCLDVQPRPMRGGNFNFSCAFHILRFVYCIIFFFFSLRSLLPLLVKEGRRILLFSQWTRILDLLDALLEVIGLRLNCCDFVFIS